MDTNNENRTNFFLTGKSVKFAAQDRFERSHDYLRISLTDRCNLACTYCMPDIPCFFANQDLLTDVEINEIAEVFVKELGVQKIRLTGGEPLIRKGAIGIMESLSQLPVELAITTNGVLLDRFFDLFDKIGLTSLNISLDSLFPESYRQITKRDLFYRVFENINRALALGFHVKINTVIKKGMNEHEILDFVNWTRYSPLHVRFIEFMPFENNQWKWDKVISYAKILNHIETHYSVQKLEDEADSTAKSYQVPGFMGTFAVISSVTEPFCANCNRIRLTADGKLRNCLFAQKELDLVKPLREGKEIVPLIKRYIGQKYYERGGLNAFNHHKAESEYASGRCMTAIGG